MNPWGLPGATVHLCRSALIFRTVVHVRGGAFNLLENQALCALAPGDHQSCVQTLFFYCVVKNRAILGKFFS